MILRNQHILTVSDSKDFIARKGMIRLFIKKRKVGFDINQHAASKAGLEIGSQLLRNARRVIRKK